MKKIQIKIDPHSWIMLFGYDKEEKFPWRKLPQLLVSSEDSEAYVYLTEKRVDELILALQEIKKTFPKKEEWP